MDGRAVTLAPLQETGGRRKGQEPRSSGVPEGRVSALRKQEVPAEETAGKLDLAVYSNEFPSVRRSGVDLRALNRMYDLATSPNAAVRSARFLFSVGGDGCVDILRCNLTLRIATSKLR